MTLRHDTSETGPRPMPTIGTVESITRTITDADVRLFANLTGDHNPVHLDADYAATTRFREPIAHGILTSGLISAVIGTKLPGLGAIYLNQTLKFMAPVFHGDTITASAEVIATRPEKRILTLRTACVNQHGRTVIEGEAVVIC